MPEFSGPLVVGTVSEVTAAGLDLAPVKIEAEWLVDGEPSTAIVGNKIKPSTSAEGKTIQARFRITFPGGETAFTGWTEAAVVSPADVVPPKTQAGRPGRPGSRPGAGAAEPAEPAAKAWPKLYGTGTGTNEILSKFFFTGKTSGAFYPAPVYRAETPSFAGYDTKTGMGPRGEGFGPAAYAAWQGDDALDDMVLAAIRSGLKPGQEPSCQGGYSAQHEEPWHQAVWYAMNTPRIWNKLSGDEQRKAVLIAGKANLLAHAVAGREAGDKFSRNLLGNSNSSTLQANTNIRTANRACVLAGAAVLGGAAEGKAFLDGITEHGIQALYDELRALGIKNTALSFAPDRNPGAPTYAQMAAKANRWTTSGHSLAEPGKILATELEDAFCHPVMLATTPLTSGPARGSGCVLKAASAELRALVGQRGMLDEFRTMDMGGKFNVKGDRSSAEYGMKAMRVTTQAFAHALVSGLVSRTDPDVLKAYERFKVGLAMFREVTRDSVGWKSFAQGGQMQSGPWNWSLMTSGQSEQWGILPWLALGDVVCAIMEGKPEPEIHDARYFQG